MKKSRTLILMSLLLVVGMPTGFLVREYRQEERNHSLIAAIYRNDEKAVAALLKDGADANARDQSEDRRPPWKQLLDRLLQRHSPSSLPSTALLVAINREHENSAVIATLLDYGADPELRDTDGVAPLFVALQNDRLDLVNLLLDHHADVNADNGNGKTVLMWAAGWFGPEEIDLFLKYGARPDTQYEDGETALMFAVGKGREENVRCLLSHHANPGIVDSAGNSPLSVARSNLASHTHTPFNAEGDEEWQPIVDMLKRSSAKR